MKEKSGSMQQEIATIEEVQKVQLRMVYQNHNQRREAEDEAMCCPLCQHYEEGHSGFPIPTQFESQADSCLVFWGCGAYV